MFQIGDCVVNAGNGLCRIADIVHLDHSFHGKDSLYYMLVPLEEQSAKIYIPVDSQKQRIRKAIDEAEAWKIIDEISDIDEMWIGYEKQREQKYKEAIASCEPRQLVSIIKTMYLRKQKRCAEGKKSTSVDERYFKLAEHNLYAELAFALGKKKEEMQQLIETHIKGKYTDK